MEDLEALFAKALKLESPWKITRVDFQESEGKIKVFVDFPQGRVLRCPVYGKEVKAYDTPEKERISRISPSPGLPPLYEESLIIYPTR